MNPPQPADYAAPMAGAIAIVIVLLVIPVLVLISGGVAAAVFGQSLGRDADARAAEAGPAGRELLQLDD
jgi:flagellar basal body-associated protein FliL